MWKNLKKAESNNKIIMNSRQLFNQIKEKGSYLCVGLDTDYNNIPRHLLEAEYPLFEFNKRIVKATADLAVAYKPNLAFYESMGTSGWMSLELTVNYIRTNFPEMFIIADAKRGDIGNTSKMYASAFFHNMDFDAVTVAPYMGIDSVSPFLEYHEKWVILLALTSNSGSQDFQQLKTEDENKYLFEKVLETSKEWGNKDNMMYVVGATKADNLKNIRKIVPDHFLLIPGIGAQGGSLEEVSINGLNKECGLLVNASRSIIYADLTNKFDKVARDKALELKLEMEKYLIKEKIL
jgi:orotidine-5'-phosphate decarboxylase